MEVNPAVALTIDTSPPAWPPNVLLVRGMARIRVVDGVFPEYIAAANLRVSRVRLTRAWCA